jgi:phosphotransferase system enzyme I (PtsP)
LLEDIGSLVSRSHDLQETLEEITQTIAERMGADVCSLYLFDQKDKRLTLWATTGLDRTAVGKVSMNVAEGLTGLVIEKMESVAVTDAMTHPRNKYFPETGEERFHSFLGLPIADRRGPLGVLVVQSRSRRRFSRTEARLLKAISSHLSSIIVQAQLLETLKTKERERQEYRTRMMEAIKRLSVYEREQHEKPNAERRASRLRLTGVSASPGFGVGQAHLVHPPIHFNALTERHTEDTEAEIHHFHAAVQHSIREIEALKERVLERLPEIDRAIFDVHRMMLEDPGFTDKVVHLIQEGFAAETALKKVVEEYVEALSRVGDEHLRERSADIRDIGQRVLLHLLGLEDKEGPRGERLILVAEELTLSDLCRVDHAQLCGVVLASGGATSHASILAKSFEIPTVVGVEHADLVQQGDEVIVDGNSGVVYINPGLEVVREYERLNREYQAFNRHLQDIHDLPAETQDSVRIRLSANVGLLSDLKFAQRHGAEGIGLYRTEVPFLTYRDFPSEEEQLSLYRRVVSGMGGQPVTIRTLDLGPDKYPSYLRLPRQDNPFLGWRSIRISLEMADLFKLQLRAILQAGAHGPVRILFPMISSVEEILQVKELLAEAKEELRREEKAFDPWMPIGIMVEVPAAVWLSDRLVKEVDFFSIGTNDLIQYLLAVDRNNRKVAPLYEPLHPAVLTAVFMAVQAAKRAGRRVSMCGEMAADPLCTLILLGMGFDELSMEPFFVPVIKRVIRSLSYANALRLTQEVLQLETVQEVKGRLFMELKRLGMIELVEMYH